jgi:hypothetical protein
MYHVAILKGGSTMANKIQAINAYRPRFKKGRKVDKDDIARWLEDRTLLTEGQARAGITDLAKAAKFYLLEHRDVEIVGLGKLVLELGLDGEVRLSLRVEPDFMADLVADLKVDSETVENADNIGKTSEELFDIWDAAHPDDLIVRD